MIRLIALTPSTIHTHTHSLSSASLFLCCAHFQPNPLVSFDDFTTILHNYLVNSFNPLTNYDDLYHFFPCTLECNTISAFCGNQTLCNSAENVIFSAEIFEMNFDLAFSLKINSIIQCANDCGISSRHAMRKWWLIAAAQWCKTRERKNMRDFCYNGFKSASSMNVKS